MGVEDDRPSDGVGRRRLLGGLAVGAAGGLLAACSSGADRSTRADSAAVGDASAPTGDPGAGDGSACALTPELTAGPYHLDGPAVRRDITEGRPGAPLALTIKVTDATCRPVTNAAVDVWHCDAGGEYSGFNGNSLDATNQQGTNDKRFLRGIQLTDGTGAVTFETIYPGWYEGRAIHVHLRTVVGGSEEDTTYDGGHVSHTG